MKIEDFLRFYPLRSQNIMWFVGAGASAAAGIPTAGDLIRKFKRNLYCAKQKVSIEFFADLADPNLLARLQQFFDSLNEFSAVEKDDEYAFYFERAYPAESDRRRVIEEVVKTATPSFGHLALAALLKLDKSRVVWTTNFDRLVEDAIIVMQGTSAKFVSATLSEPELALQAINEGRWPIVVKLHGDFQSRRLKNTVDELSAQDAKLRRSLVEACQRYGLAIVGYSGRDKSVLDSLDEAIKGGEGFPQGLFWFQRGDNQVSPRVLSLIEKARSNGIDAHIIESETFGELFQDILLLIPDLPLDVRNKLQERRPRVTDAPVPSHDGALPIVRVNALAINSPPTVCRRLVCKKIGGAAEVKEAIKKSGASVVAARRRFGIIAFGSDEQVRKAFGSYDIAEFDLHSIEHRSLAYESAELGLLYDALARAIVRQFPLIVERGRSGVVALVSAEKMGHASFEKLRKALGSLTGVVPGTGLKWAEALRLSLQYRLGKLWLVFEPFIWLEKTTKDDSFTISREFARKQTATRYNKKWNTILDAWISTLSEGKDEFDLRAFEIGDGVDAVFKISNKQVTSRRRVC